MPDLNSTQYFKVNNETEIAVKDILEAVYIALTEKGILSARSSVILCPGTPPM